MRVLPLVFLAALPACSNEANHLGNPLLLPISGIGAAIENAAYQSRRGAVELAVKSNWPSVLREIEGGGGPALGQAMEAARIPDADRAARILQMQGDLAVYRESPEALVVALMVYGG